VSRWEWSAIKPSALDRARCHPCDDLPVEENEQDQRWDGDQQDGGEQQVVLGCELALEVEQGELNGGVLGSGQECGSLR
jgi:hypothetical protein